MEASSRLRSAIDAQWDFVSLRMEANTPRSSSRLIVKRPNDENDFHIWGKESLVWFVFKRHILMM